MNFVLLSQAFVSMNYTPVCGISCFVYFWNNLDVLWNHPALVRGSHLLEVIRNQEAIRIEPTMQDKFSTPEPYL